MFDSFKLFLSGLKSQLGDIWAKSKVILLAMIGVILALEFGKIKEALIVYAGKKEIQKDEAKDAELAKDENSANSHADALVKEAQELPAKEKPIDDDWNVKK